MKICIVNCYFGHILKELGHDVFELNTSKHGIYDLHGILKKKKFNPDLIIQKEHLASKILLSNIHKFECKKAFWSIDTHLNFFWQSYYMKMFDIMFTPHVSYLNKTAKFWCDHNMYGLPNYAPKVDFCPHSSRKYSINMIARMSPDRHCRNNLSIFLKKHYNTNILSGVSYEYMLDIYSNTRIVPNESIAFETNFRILEGSACGCCVISPDIGDDQDSMFERGKEILIYTDAMNLAETIDKCLSSPKFAEEVGYAAWERVQRDHLLEHRVKTILSELQTVEQMSSKSPDYFNASAAMMAISGQIYTEKTFLHIQKIENTTLKFLIELSASIFSSNIDKTETLIEYAKNEICHNNTCYAFAKSLSILCAGYLLHKKKFDKACYFIDAYENLLTNMSKTVSNDRSEKFYHLINLLTKDNRYALYGTSHTGYVQTVLDLIYNYMSIDGIEPEWAIELLSSQPIVNTYPLLAQGAAARVSLQKQSIESDLAYIEQSFRFLDTDRAMEAIEGVIERTKNSRECATFRKLLLKKHPYCEKFMKRSL